MKSLLIISVVLIVGLSIPNPPVWPDSWESNLTIVLPTPDPEGQQYTKRVFVDSINKKLRYDV
jgi:hypothetical protein